MVFSCKIADNEADGFGSINLEDVTSTSGTHASCFFTRSNELGRLVFRAGEGRSLRSVEEGCVEKSS